ncbi:MAG: ABC transporter ATP-binding protein, partial [Blastocatellia bacterium]
LERIAQGTIRVDSRDTKRMAPKELARVVAYVPQSDQMQFAFKVIEVVLTGRNPHLGRFSIESAQDLDLALDALDQVGIAQLASRPYTSLSAGQRQLVLVARAIAQAPSLLLMDEPSGFLDLKNRARLVKILRRLRDERDISSLVVTHDLMFLEPSFDLVFALGEGHIVASGPPGSVLHSAILKEIYGVDIRTFNDDGKIFLWSEV